MKEKNIFQRKAMRRNLFISLWVALIVVFVNGMSAAFKDFLNFIGFGNPWALYYSMILGMAIIIIFLYALRDVAEE